MHLLLATALAAAAPMSAVAAAGAATASCSWNEPGHNRYRGTLAAAVDRYTDIPLPVRERLKARMASFRYDEMAAIRRDSITGQARYAPEIRDMHFGAGQVCGSVDRSRWDEHMVERGLVYCEDEHCLIVPTVCRNVSRVTRLATPEQVQADGRVPGSPLAGGGGAAGPALPSAAGPTTDIAAAPDTELDLPATGAGPSFEDTRTAGAGGPVSSAGGGAPAAPLPGAWWPGLISGGGGGGFGPAGEHGPSPEPISLVNIGGVPGPDRPPASPGNGGSMDPGTTPLVPPGTTPGTAPGPSPETEPGLLPLGPSLPAGPWPAPPTSPPLVDVVNPPIPEPASGVLVLLGGAVLYGWRRWKGRQQAHPASR